MKDKRAEIEQVNNGFTLRLSWKEPRAIQPSDGPQAVYPDYDYKSEEYVASTMDDAMKRVSAFFGAASNA